MPEQRVVLFLSASLAIRAERVLKEEGYEIKMIPTARPISLDCGMALRVVRHVERRVAVP